MAIFCRFAFVAWLFLGLGIYLIKNGEPKEGNYSFGAGLFSSVIQLLLLWGGGFFG